MKTKIQPMSYMYNHQLHEFTYEANILFFSTLWYSKNVFIGIQTLDLKT